MRDIANIIYAAPLEYIIAIIFLLLFIWAGLGYIAEQNKKLVYVWKRFNILIFVVDICVILYMTLMRREAENFYISLIPFRLIYEAQKQPEIYRSMLMNIFLFVPLGLTLPFILSETHRYKMILIILEAFALSVMIEVLQGIFRLGCAEVDDVICNTFGAAIGVLAYKMQKKLKVD